MTDGTHPLFSRQAVPPLRGPYQMICLGLGADDLSKAIYSGIATTSFRAPRCEQLFPAPANRRRDAHRLPVLSDRAAFYVDALMV